MSLMWRIRDLRFFPGWVRHQIQYLCWGFSDKDTWSLDYTIAKFVLPRLKRFKEVNCSFPGGKGFTEETWDETLDKMIYAMESVVADCATFDDDIKWKQVDEGLELFGKHFRHLWS